MSEDEWVVMIVSIVLAVVGLNVNATRGLSVEYRRDNPGIGLVRLAVLAAMGWIVFVLAKFADPSVKGIYDVFYVVMGYAAVKVFGQLGGRMFGVHMRVDVGERRNWPAAVFLGAYTLGTGLIFGGSLWGEADPQGGGEGGWWIPVGFFLLGWIVMTVGLAVYCRREPGRFRQQLRQERDMGTAWGAASFTVSAAVLMTDAVSGDFFGWASGLKDVGLAAGMLLAHEFLQLPEGGDPKVRRLLRWVETVLYPILAAIAWICRGW